MIDDRTSIEFNFSSLKNTVNNTYRHTNTVRALFIGLLRLPLRRCSVQVAGIGGFHQMSPSCSMVGFPIAAHSTANQDVKPSWNIETVVLHRITTSDLPTCPVPLERNWKRLAGLHLTDPDFSIPGRVDILLGIDVFNVVILHSRRIGLVGSPSALETHLRWVLSGTIHPK